MRRVEVGTSSKYVLPSTWNCSPAPHDAAALRVSALYSLLREASFWWRYIVDWSPYAGGGVVWRGCGVLQDRRGNLLGLEDDEGGAGHLGDVVEHYDEEDAGADQL